MNILIIGNGGREHALAWKCAQSAKVRKIFVAPGNAGTNLEDKCENIAIEVTDIQALAAFAKDNACLTLVGPEVPLVLGVVDIFQELGLKIFGPKQYAAQLEGSKAFAKDFLVKYNIPTAFYQVFTQVDKAVAYIQEKGAPIVIKADGLASGKGVIVAMTELEAIAAVKDMLINNSFGKSGSRVVIEEFLDGEEASFIVMCDGENALAMATSQDHKRVGDGDTGVNTGGMGAYSPAPVVTDAIHKLVMEQVIYPTMQGMKAEGTPYTGFLYAGLMIDPQGNARVIEFNCRFGDPETQPIMLRMQSDLVELIELALAQKLDKATCKWDKRPAVGVVLAAKNYPQTPQIGDVISGLCSHKELDKNQSCLVKTFIAGAQISEAKIITSGGRVLCVTALGEDVKTAQANAYAQIKNISFDGMFYRKDIAHRALV
ncbi:phosphoribosylglycinamide synthetase phosphoribosylamine-glycine ligase [Gammaproteobacteria bacterium]|nr:phosphoribosylglycinamide synthetase phosphoribosylamine-glycine ligase [Gammaproteobacteria bacterium]